MVGSSISKRLLLLWVYPAVVFAISTNFVNPDMPYMRPTFVVNFDMGTVICQHTPDADDLHVHPISVLCDGISDCYRSSAIHDEKFPLCNGGCISQCGKHGTCLNDGEVAHCFCDSGFHGDQCQFSDNNECSNSPCSQFATCTNTFGSYYCSCLPGYRGDGFACTDVNECVTGAADCPNQSSCVNLPGTYYCNCTDGYVPSGVPFNKCIDIDECYYDLGNCPTGKLCQNTLGSYNCSSNCGEGFLQLDDKTCGDINECELENSCADRSICENIPGGYECKCEPGFTGDGHRCEPSDQCSSNPDICDLSAFCIGALHMCFCQKGYIGNGITCSDLDECEELEFPCASKEDRCLNVPGTYLCCNSSRNDDQCRNDFGFECSGKCALDAECNQGECVCKSGLQGNPYKRCHVGSSRYTKRLDEQTEQKCGRDAVLSHFLSLCLCLPGFRSWKNITGCVDIDECGEGISVCGANEWCANTHGSYICCDENETSIPCQKARNNANQTVFVENKTQIKYAPPIINHSSIKYLSEVFKELDGQTKVESTTLSSNEIFGLEYSGEVDEKESLGISMVCGNVVCGIAAVCIVDQCRCQPGYSGHPTIQCYDVNECIVPGDVCLDLPNSWCVNTPGSYYCCHPGTKSVDCLGLVIEARPHSQESHPDQGTPFIEELPKIPYFVQEIPSNLTTAESRSTTVSSEWGHGSWKEIGQRRRTNELDIVRGCRSDDNCGRDAICERRSGVCRCRAGFVGSPPEEQCIDADECELDLDDCHRSSTCLNNVGGYTCQCSQGHRPIGRVCIDINECTEKNPCHRISICTNLPGSVQCECPRSHYGDGYECLELTQQSCSKNERAQANCDEHRLCFVSENVISGRIGPPKCNRCKQGFKDVAGVCRDKNECATRDAGVLLCGDHAHCVNTVGGYHCECDLGYIGDGQLCADVDECRRGRFCHPQATCINTQGAYFCQCPDGWKGDGATYCYHPQTLVCQSEASCPPNSNCLSVEGQKVCQCAAGYFYHNETQQCEDVDECAEGRDECNPVAQCLNSVGAYQCRCKKGFRGNGHWCTDINECSESLHSCEFRAHCTNSIGSYDCHCPESLIGDGFTCTSPVNDSCPLDLLLKCQKVNKKCALSESHWGCGECLTGYSLVTDAFLLAIDPTERCADDDECQGSNHGCHENAVCYNLPGSFRCRCRPGYTGDGGECWFGLPGSDCSSASKNTCDVNADCIDVEPGRHFCSCREGFIGDGTKCDDVDECFLPHLCSDYAKCINVPGSYKCQCNQGYIGDGMLCSAVCPAGGTPDTSVRRCSGSADACPIGYECVNEMCCPVPEPTNCAFNRSMCDGRAQCLAGRCVCEPGYIGDGVVCIETPTQPSATLTTESLTGTSTSKAIIYSPSTDTLFTHSTDSPGSKCADRKCHPFADCHANKCICWPNFVGDGIQSCLPHPDDCIYNERLCIGDTVCRLPGRRCICSSGRHPIDRFGNCNKYQSVVTNNKEVYSDAKCKGSACDYSGGISSNTKKLTCSLEPTLCHKWAYCKESRCVCKDQYIGDGITCYKKSQKLQENPLSVVCNGERCSREAYCAATVIGKRCTCKDGYKGNGKQCQDIDECTELNSPCATNGICVNNAGSFGCTCGQGYRGDGHSFCIVDLTDPQHITVSCDPDGMGVVMRHDTGFDGQIFVRSQSRNPFCSKTFTSADGPIYKFKANFAHCNIKKEGKSLFSTTVVVQQHPLFVTDAADVYQLECSYPTGLKSVQSHFNVSDIETERLEHEAPEATCELFVTNADTGTPIEESIVGERLRLTLQVQPKMFGVRPSNCLAVNMDQGETYALTDDFGCAIEPDIFPEWTNDTLYSVFADFVTFKWPDSTHLRFQCDCSACLKECEKIDCDARRRQQRSQVGALPYKVRRRRSGRSTKRDLPTFSPVVTVKDTDEQTQAQMELEIWRATNMTYPTRETVEDTKLCISAMTLGIVLAILTCLTSTLIFIALTCWCSYDCDRLQTTWPTQNNRSSSQSRDDSRQESSYSPFRWNITRPRLWRPNSSEDQNDCTNYDETMSLSTLCK